MYILNSSNQAQQDIEV